MKKLLILMLVLCLSASASAITVSLIDPGVTVDGETVLYLQVDADGLEDLGLTLDITGDAQFTGGIQNEEAADWGAEVQYLSYNSSYAWDGGWQSDLSADVAISNGGLKAELGMGMFASTIHGATSIPVVTADTDLTGTPYTPYNTPVAYVLIEGTGTGGATITITNGSQFGSPSTVWDAGDSLGISTLPEPATLALLGLGGLFLRRRRKA